MKIVGGPLDGKEVELPPYQNDYFALKRIEPGEVTVALCSELGRITPVKVEHIRYTVRTLGGQASDGKIERYYFLAPDEWSDMQALRHQFSK